MISCWKCLECVSTHWNTLARLWNVPEYTERKFMSRVPNSSDMLRDAKTRATIQNTSEETGNIRSPRNVTWKCEAKRKEKLLEMLGKRGLEDKENGALEK